MANKIEILPRERYAEIEEVYECEFDSVLPVENEGIILAELSESGEILSFMLIEIVYRVGLIHRVAEKAGNMRGMIRAAINLMPENSSVFVIASEPKYENLCQKLKMERQTGAIYRRDF
ncbi:MAG: hypothetical protein H0X49_13310 [Acidobacteria bacterium]|nr:hypothetical protein [Acidobacteriota bacterium]